MQPALTAIARGLPETVPFVGPEALERRSGVATRARLGANESSFGPSPQVVRAMREAAPEVWQYGDPEMFDLRAALAAHLGVPPANIAIGEGIDGLQGLIARLFIEPGAVAVTSLGAYPTFNYHVAGFGGRVVGVPYTADDREDLGALAETARREGARVVYLSNPDNPMGSWWPAAELQSFFKAVPEQTLILLDEAYSETAPPAALPPLLPLQPNLLRTRTFSKAYGLAGMRIGYAVGDAPLIGAFDRVRNHFGVTRMSQLAARAAIGDQNYLSKVVAMVVESRARLAEIAAANGLRALPSATNFVAIDCGHDGAYALRVLEGLGRRGVFIRKPLAPRLDRCIRVSAGRPEELDILAEELPPALREAAG